MEALMEEIESTEASESIEPGEERFSETRTIEIRTKQYEVIVVEVLVEQRKGELFKTATAQAANLAKHTRKFDDDEDVAMKVRLPDGRCIKASFRVCRARQESDGTWKYQLSDMEGTVQGNETWFPEAELDYD